MKSDVSSLIAKELIRKLENFEPNVSARRVGYVVSIADGVAKVSGLPHVAYLELGECPNGFAGVAMNLEE